MGARLGHVAVLVVLLLGGCGHRSNTSTEAPSNRPTTVPESVTSVPDPTSTPQPYVDAAGGVRRVAEAFVREALEYDATTEDATAFLGRVAPVTTSAELDRLRTRPRAHLDWRALRARQESVTVAVTGISVAATGRVLVTAERITTTSFATVRDFVQVSLELVPDSDGSLKVADAKGGGL